jgi:hypothetical protein
LISSVSDLSLSTQKQKAMLEYSKLILQKVSFSRELFCKELLKAIRLLNGKEVAQLRNWCVATFGLTYSDVIREAFSQAGN